MGIHLRIAVTHHSPEIRSSGWGDSGVEGATHKYLLFAGRRLHFHSCQILPRDSGRPIRINFSLFGIQLQLSPKHKQKSISNVGGRIEGGTRRRERDLAVYSERPNLVRLWIKHVAATEERREAICWFVRSGFGCPAGWRIVVCDWARVRSGERASRKFYGDSNI